MRVVHQILGWAIVGGFGGLWLWSMGTWFGERLLRRVSGPGRPFWWLLGLLQGAILVQALAGVVLLALGGRASALHYVYGIIFPFLLLVVAHVLARETFAHRPWLVFGWAAFFIFGLTIRALATGMGWS